VSKLQNEESGGFQSATWGTNTAITFLYFIFKESLSALTLLEECSS
jgi:hypothetical protein